MGNEEKIIEFRMAMAKRLKQFRKTLRMTQDEFSRALGVSKPAYVRYEAGDRFPTIRMIYILHHLYKMDTNWLITGRGEMFSPDNTPLQTWIQSMQLEDPEKYKKYLYMIELMEHIPEIEQAILSKAAELKRIFKEDIEKNLPVQKNK